MARLPIFKRIRPEEFPTLDWMPRLAEPLNRFMEETVRAFNRQLTFGENMDAAIIRVEADGTYPKKVRWARDSKPVAAWIGQAREIDETHTDRTSAIDLDWEYTADGQFQVNAIPNLGDSLSTKFNVTIVAITG